jgi:UrcA family protein
MITINLKFAGLAFAAALATSAATLVATGAPAAAATPIVVEATQVPTARVAHEDLNLRTAAGVRRLQARVRRAAEQLCIEPNSKSLQVVADGKACVRVAIEQASPQVDQAIGIQAAQIGAGGK